MYNYIDNSTPTNNYWEQRYSKSGTSGEGSLGTHRDWKWKTISNYAGRVDNVIDVGCGDLSFWDGKNCQTYTGIDISGTIVRKNLGLRPDWNFICSDASVRQSVRAPVVFCFDVLFHIMDDGVYKSILTNLMAYSDQWIFLYTWVKNPLSTFEARRQIFLDSLKGLKLGFALNTLVNPVRSDARYQTYRDFREFIPHFQSNGYRLVSLEKYPYDDVGGMYIFRKSD